MRTRLQPFRPLILAFGTTVALLSPIAAAAPANAAEMGTCPSGSEQNWEAGRLTAKSIAKEAAGFPRIVISDARLEVSKTPGVTVSIGSTIRYSAFAGSVVEVARNKKFLGAGWGRISIKTSESTGCAWALISDRSATGSGTFWMDVAPDATRTDRWRGLVLQGFYDAGRWSAYHGPVTQIPSQGAVRACAMFTQDANTTFCTQWVRPS